MTESECEITYCAGVSYLRIAVGQRVKEARSLDDPEAVEVIFSRIETVLRDATAAADAGLLEGSRLVTVHGSRLDRIKNRMLERCDCKKRTENTS